MSASGLRKLDYFSFTVKDCTCPSQIMDKLNLKFLQLGYGRYGYKAAAICDSGGVQVYWDGFKNDMGVHVQISGQGCRLIESLEGFDSWREWIGRWLGVGARVARIDLAIDDEGGTVDFETVHKAVESRSAVMRSRKTRLILDKDLDSGASYPTLYVGRRTSETMMRCYDKGLQTRSGISWLRFEFEYKGERADAVARLLVSDGWDAAIGTVRSFIEFKDESHVTSDRTRQRAASWWVQLVDASKHVLRIEREVHASLMKTYMWLRRQASTAIATLLEYEGGDMSWMIELAKEGKPKLKARHLAMLRNAGPSILGAAYSNEIEHQFQSMPNSNSNRKRTRVPIEIEHRFQRKSNALIRPGFGALFSGFRRFVDHTV